MTDSTPVQEAARAVGHALRGDATALSRLGVAIPRPPRWRRWLQARLTPQRYRLWIQRQVLDQIEDDR
jgi:hypothetical protein